MTLQVDIMLLAAGLLLGWIGASIYIQRRAARPRRHDNIIRSLRDEL